MNLPLLEGPFGSVREREAIADLAGEVQHAINSWEVGEFDGEEFGGGRCVLFMYGPDADLLFGVAEPILRTNQLARGGVAIKRYGRADNLSAVEAKVML